MAKQKPLFTHNQKTVLSVDFSRAATCPQICSYCYVEQMERIYPSYGEKIEKNALLVKETPVEFAGQLNKEWRKARKSKAKKFQKLEKLPVRMYGSGDFQPEHLEMYKNLDFKIFIISKTLTDPDFEPYLDEVLSLPNVASVVLSFDNDNIKNYNHCKPRFNSDKIKFSFTGDCDDFMVQKEWNNKEFNMFFNTDNKKKAKERSRQWSERCPADSGDIPLKQACTQCHKCWHSSVTKEADWNKVPA